MEALTKIEEAIKYVLSKNISLNFGRWYPYRNCSFFEGPSFATKNDKGEVSKVCPMGAVMFHDHQLNQPNKPFVCGGYSTAARMLSVSDDWVVAFSRGWEGHNNSEKLWSEEPFNLGLEFRNKYREQSVA